MKLARCTALVMQSTDMVSTITSSAKLSGCCETGHCRISCENKGVVNRVGPQRVTHPCSNARKYFAI